MCNINSLFVKNKTGKLITPFMMAVTSHSFATNSDGEGFYLDSINKVIKSMNKIDYYEYSNSFENSKVIITHQRLSTSGFELEYNHPFSNDDFVLVHNGIINQFKKQIGSDTFGFWENFNNEFKRLPTKILRGERIIKVIRKLFEKDIGSYSILIYDKKTQDTYYFKGTGYPQIKFYKSNNFLFVTTNPNNSTFLSMIDSKEFKELEIKDRKIYKINPTGEVFRIADLPEEQKKFSWNTNYTEDPEEIYLKKWGLR